MELPGRRLTGIALVALIALVTWSEPPSAQTSDKSGQTGGSASGGVADQIKAGAQRIGEGIEQGAIQTWEAMKAGASAAAEKFQGGKSTPKSAAAPPARPSAD